MTPGSALGSAPAGVPPWSQLWQLPLLVAGLALFGLGLYLAMPAPRAREERHDLDEAAAYLRVNNLPEARKHLEAVEPTIDHAPVAEQGRYALLAGDLVSQSQPVNSNGGTPEARRELVDDYQKAEHLGEALDAPRLERLALAQVALDQDAPALATMARIKGEPQRRYGVVKRMIERDMERGSGSVAGVGNLLDVFAAEVAKDPDPARQRAESLWVLCVRMQGLLAANQPDAVIAELPRALGALLAAGPGSEHDMAPLDLVLAQAYEKSGDRVQALDSYQRALKRLDSAADAEAYARVLVALGRLALADYRADPTQDAHLQEALHRFSAATRGYPSSRCFLEALTGQLDCEARLGQHTLALAHAAKVVEGLRQERGASPEGAALIQDVAMQAAERLGRQNDYAQALLYLGVLAPLQGPKPPLEFLLLSAQLHEQLALQLSDQGQKLQQAAATAADKRGAEAAKAPAPWKAMFLDAAHNFELAGDEYQRHARAEMTLDVDACAASLWHAASCYDRASRGDLARDIYAEFIRVHPNDPNALKAMSRQGMALMADGQYAAAAEMLGKLCEGYPISPDTNEALAPLARCEIALKEYGKAEGHLLAVVGGNRALTPESSAYRLALIELGGLYVTTGRFEPAIARLSEAVQRYGALAQGPVLRFKLADAYRLSAPVLQTESQGQVTAAQRQALEVERAERLSEAQNLYKMVVDSLRGRDEAGLSEVEQVCLRNAYFYRADCAYDLGQFAQAIALYDEAAKRWAKYPVSLIALIQIVNADCELGRIDDARRANARAREHLKDIPLEAFNDPTLPMSRKEWEQWYRWSSDAGLFEAQASAGAAGPGASPGPAR